MNEFILFIPLLVSYCYIIIIDLLILRRFRAQIEVKINHIATQHIFGNLFKC